jgi:hypothetical protein
MSAAINAKSAQARATIARNIYVNGKVHWETGDFGRRLDDCFEMGDGDQVADILAERVKTDVLFRQAILEHADLAPNKALAVAKTLPRPTQDELLQADMEHWNKRFARFNKRNNKKLGFA